MDYSRAPVTVAWEITRACPLACVHCRAVAQHRRDPAELTTGEGLALIESAAGMGAKVLVITGGDPLARPDVFELISAVRVSGMYCGFSPSATPRLKRDTIERAIAAGAATLHLSLDGATAATHDAFRGVHGTFDRTRRAMHDVIDAGGRLQIGTTVSRQTVGDLEGIADLLRDCAVLWTLFFLVDTGRASRTDLLEPAEVERVLHWLATTDFGFPVRTVEAPAYRRVLAQLGRPVQPAVTDGNGFVFVSHTGDVTPSGFLPLAVGNVRDRSLEYWYRESPLFQALRDRDRLGGKCGRCEFKGLCGGSRSRAWAATGDPLGADPGCAYRPNLASLV